MICDKCQAKASDDSNFCRLCGNPLSERKRNLFLVYRGLAVVEFYLVAIFFLVGFGILYGNYKQGFVKPPPSPAAPLSSPREYKRVWWLQLNAHPEKYRGALLETGGIVSELCPLKDHLGILLNTVRISSHGGWTAPVYVLCDRNLLKDSEIGINDIVLAKGRGSGTRIVTVEAKPIEVATLEADMVEVTVKSGAQ